MRTEQTPATPSPPKHHPSPALEPLIVSIKDAATLLGNVSTRHVYQLIHTQGLPSMRIGKRRLAIPLHGLKEWLQQRSAPSIIGIATGPVAKEIRQCHTGGQTRIPGGRPTQMQAAKELGDLLGLKTERRQKQLRRSGS
ncbi:MAG: helix-turn-helix domain-containing protein [Magnetococcales bacterium]|nr:helix-turn-helix domain-containing protein [Magnetococcales bacterium]